MQMNGFIGAFLEFWMDRFVLISVYIARDEWAIKYWNDELKEIKSFRMASSLKLHIKSMKNVSALKANTKDKEIYDFSSTLFQPHSQGKRRIKINSLVPAIKWILKLRWKVSSKVSLNFSKIFKKIVYFRDFPEQCLKESSRKNNFPTDFHCEKKMAQSHSHLTKHEIILTIELNLSLFAPKQFLNINELPRKEMKALRRPFFFGNY